MREQLYLSNNEQIEIAKEIYINIETILNQFYGEKIDQYLIKTIEEIINNYLKEVCTVYNLRSLYSEIRTTGSEVTLLLWFADTHSKVENIYPDLFRHK